MNHITRPTRERGRQRYDIVDGEYTLHCRVDRTMPIIIVCFWLLSLACMLMTVGYVLSVTGLRW